MIGRTLYVTLAAMALLAGGTAAAAADFPHGTVSLPVGTGEAEFHASGDLAVLTVRLPDGNVMPLRGVGDVDDALAILADRRLAFTWPALLAWAGDDLALLRDRELARSRMAAEAGMLASAPVGQSERWANDPALSTQLHFARALVDAGREPEAVAMLRKHIADAPGDAEHSYVPVFLTIRLANVLFEAGDTAAAVATLEAAQRDHALDGEFKLNIDVNLAMLLARSHQSQRALILIDDAWRQFDAEAAESDAFVKVPSSEASFAWIKACALDGLGSHDKARTLIAGIAAPPPWPSEDKVSAEARINAWLCMGDDAGLAAELAAQLDAAAPAADVLLTLQPDAHGYAPDAAVTAAAVRRPALARAIAAHARLLPPVFAPALAKWRNAAPAGAATP